jgi:tetratricopeptide (TPR) repeat protein
MPSLIHGWKNNKSKKIVIEDYYISLIDTLTRFENYEEAKLIFEKGKQYFIEDSYQMGMLYFKYGKIYEATARYTEDYKEANKYYKKSYSIFEKHVNCTHLDIIRCHSWIAIMYFGIGNFDKAIYILNKRLLDFKKYYAPLKTEIIC